MLELRNVGFGYGKGVPVVQHQTRIFRPGQMIALTGASGRGKSTLLYILGLMLKPTSGMVIINEERVDDLADSARARLRASKFGFVFQDAALDPTRTVLDNVLESTVYTGAGRRGATARARLLLDRFGVLERIEGKPGQVSGGQAQRIALARALLGSPEIVLADEPTGNLDRDSAEVVLQAFRSSADAGAIVIIATHDASVEAVCDSTWKL